MKTAMTPALPAAGNAAVSMPAGAPANTAVSPASLDRLNFQTLLAFSTQIIERGLQLAQRPCVSTKFGPQSAVLLHLLTTRCPRIPVIWVDTGYNTRATLRFVDRLSSRLDLNLQTFRPLNGAGEQQDGSTLAFPPALDDPGHPTFVRRVKLEPFARALEQLRPDAWFSGIRREQTAHRAAQRHFERAGTGDDGPGQQPLKVAPLLDWRDADMQAYLRRHDLPSETDHYDPTKGEPHRECGLHLAF